MTPQERIARLKRWEFGKDSTELQWVFDVAEAALRVYEENWPEADCQPADWDPAEQTWRALRERLYGTEKGSHE